MSAYVGGSKNLKDLKDLRLRGSSAILCTGGVDVIRKEAWPFYRTISDVRLCWVLEEPKGPKGTGVCDHTGVCGILEPTLGS